LKKRGKKKKQMSLKAVTALIPQAKNDSIIYRHGKSYSIINECVDCIDDNYQDLSISASEPSSTVSSCTSYSSDSKPELESLSDSSDDDASFLEDDVVEVQRRSIVENLQTQSFEVSNRSVDTQQVGSQLIKCPISHHKPEQSRIQRVNDWRSIVWYCTKYLFVDEVPMVTESQLRGVMHIHRPKEFAQFTDGVGQSGESGGGAKLGQDEETIAVWGSQ
jgi:hypothetical protein